MVDEDAKQWILSRLTRESSWKSRRYLSVAARHIMQPVGRDAPDEEEKEGEEEGEEEEEEEEEGEEEGEEKEEEEFNCASSAEPAPRSKQETYAGPNCSMRTPPPTTVLLRWM